MLSTAQPRNVGARTVDTLLMNATKRGWFVLQTTILPRLGMFSGISECFFSESLSFCPGQRFRLEPSRRGMGGVHCSMRGHV